MTREGVEMAVYWSPLPNGHLSEPESMNVIIPLFFAVAVGLIAFVLVLTVVVPMVLGLFVRRR